jgi:drug/metabolite transporter (DMT)-like permease
MSGRAASAEAPLPATPSLLRSVGFLLPLSIVLFGASWPVVKTALATAGATPVWLAASRSGLACGTLVALLGLRGHLRLPSRADLPTLLAVGVLQLTGFFSFCHYAVRLVPAGHTAVLSNSALIWIVPIAALVGWREPLTRWLAAGMALAGVAVLIGPWSVQWAQPDVLLGYTLLLAAALVWACTIIVTRLWPPQAEAMALLPWAFALSFGLLFALASVTEREGGIPSAAWPYAAFNGVVVAPLGTYCLIELSRRLTPTVSSILFMAIPIAGVFASALVLGEAIGMDLMLGGGMIAAGVGLAAREHGPEQRVGGTHAQAGLSDLAKGARIGRPDGGTTAARPPAG